MNNDKENQKLIAACRNGYHVECQRLLKAGVDPNYRVTDHEIGWTPLFLASRGCYPETVRVLLAHGADVHVRSRQSDNTCLHSVVWNKHAIRGMTETVHALLEAGANVNAANARGQTPLHWAAHYGHLEAVRLLVKYGADTRVRNEDGETPLDKALARSSHRHAQDIADILQHGAAPQHSVLQHLWGRLPTVKKMRSWHQSLIFSMSNVHEGKLYYTLLRKLVATKVCSAQDAEAWLEKAFDRLSNTLKSAPVEASFRLLLDKAVEDGMIPQGRVELMPRADRGDADSTISSDGPTRPASFVEFCASAAQPENFRYEHLDGSTQSMQNAMGLLFQKMMVLNLDERELLIDTESRSSISLEKQQRLEIQMQALVSMVRGVLNVILRGADEKQTFRFERICAHIMDWGDLAHVSQCIAEENCDETEGFLQSFENGVKLARDVAENIENESTGRRLDNVFDKKEPFLLLGMIAAMGQPDYGKIQDDQHFENFYVAKKAESESAPKEDADAPKSSSDSDTKSESYSSVEASRREDSFSSQENSDQASCSAESDASIPRVKETPIARIPESAGRDRRLSHSAPRMSPIAETGVKSYATGDESVSRSGSPQSQLSTLQATANATRSIVSAGGSSSSSSASYQQESVVFSTAPKTDIERPAEPTQTTSLPKRTGRISLPIQAPVRHSFSVTPVVAMAVWPSLPRRSSAPPDVLSNTATAGLREIYPDALLSQEDEDELVLHAAVKFGDIDLLKDQLDEVSAEELNAKDSCGRTAMDLAALTGQTELVKMLEEKGGQFLYKRQGPMLAVARLRSLYVAQYLKLVEEEI